MCIRDSYDTTKYEPSIIEFAEDPDCDLIIVNSADVKEIIEKVAPDYPDKRFVIYDSDIDYSAADQMCIRDRPMKGDHLFLH